MTSTLHPFVTASLIGALAYLACLGTMTIVAALRTGGRRDDPGDQHDVLSVSRFTIPVSIVIPVNTNMARAMATINAALALNYPEHEVIVVLDDSPPGLLDTFAREWNLEAREFFYRRSIDTAPIRRLYRSRTDARLLVADKAAGGWSDAVNCGVNLARYRYVTAIAPGTAFDADALLRVMSAALRDPAHVLGTSGHLDRAANDDGEAGLFTRVGYLFSRMESLRSFTESRLARRAGRGGLDADAGVSIWRRDAVLQVGGFSGKAASPDLDMMRRLQISNVDGRRAWFHRGGEIFGYRRAESPRSALHAAALRQTAVLQTVLALIRDGVGDMSLRSVVQFVSAELVTPLALTWVVCATLGGALAGWYPWRDVLLLAVLLSFGRASVTAVAILLRGSASGAPQGNEVQRLLLLGPLEFALYRPAMAAARVGAALGFAMDRGRTAARRS